MSGAVAGSTFCQLNNWYHSVIVREEKLTFVRFKENERLGRIDPISNLQEMRKTEEHVKQYHGDAVSKILTMGNSTGQKTEFLQQIKYKGEETQGRGTRGLRVVKGMSTSCNIQTWSSPKKTLLKKLRFTRQMEIGTLNISLKVRNYCWFLGVIMVSW